MIEQKDVYMLEGMGDYVDDPNSAYPVPRRRYQYRVRHEPIPKNDPKRIAAAEAKRERRRIRNIQRCT